MQRNRLPHLLVVFNVLLMVPLTAGAQAPVWETWQNNPNNDQFAQIPYEVAFVATPIVETIGTCGAFSNVALGDYEIGADVLGATKPSPGNELWILTRNGDVKKLFPLPSYETVMVTHPDTGALVDLIDTPLGQLGKASVTDFHVSEDGDALLFTYFHDATFNIASNQGGMSEKGADSYRMDLSTLLADPTITPNASNTPVQRLTFKDYGGANPKGNNEPVDQNDDAMNLTTVNVGNNDWGTVEMHPIEVRTRDGLKYVWVSGEKRNINSNKQFGHNNYNLNLKIADINADKSMGASRQFHYYTTTSALSPTPLPNGFAFAYQATTADARNWQIQSIDSEGRWKPLIGYGSNPDLFHLGAYCVDNDGQGAPDGDYFIGTRYYNLNNNGFGSLWRINLADQGINSYDLSVQWGFKPKQKGQLRISKFVEDGDDPSKKNAANMYYGKMTSPACGAPNDLFFAHTPTSANGRKCSDDGKNVYHAYIAYRADLQAFDPTATWTPAGGDGPRIAVDDSSDAYTLAWPRPVLSWQQRTGQAQQQVAPAIIDPGTPIAPGRPYAIVGTSALYNTDRKPYDCWLKPAYQPYDPIAQATEHNINDQFISNFDALSKVIPDPMGLYPPGCAPLREEDVLGVQINLTSNKLNHNCCNLGYETDGSGNQETVRSLGVYDVRTQGDTSFKARVPANVPFEFHLLDKEFGMRLVDVRTWHSLQPRESRYDCGGCHQHEEGAAKPFAGTVASQSAPLNMVGQTQVVTYDALCTPMVTTTGNATEAMPEWINDIWVGDAGAPGITSGFDTYCGDCHRQGSTHPNAGTSAFSYTSESTAYNALKNQKWADAINGALGSPAFWAARGMRTDGRSGNYPNWNHDPIHATEPDLCGQNNPPAARKAAWVAKLGQWIDNLMPRDTGLTFGGKTLDAKWDRYHPTVDGAVIDSTCQGRKLRIGYWDDSGTLAAVDVTVNGTPLGPTLVNVPNGVKVYSGLNIGDRAVVKVTGIDADGNRIWYEKTGLALKKVCKPTVVQVEDPIQLPLP